MNNPGKSQHHEPIALLQELLSPASEPSLSLIDLKALANSLAKEAKKTLSALTSTEQEQFAGYHYPKRQLEWLGGRLAAKEALLNHPLRPEGKSDSWEVRNDRNGRPFFRDITGRYPAEPPDLSISHSGGWAGALTVLDQRAGLDIQLITPKLIRVRERFCSRTEAEIIAELTELPALSLLWSAKEALRKALGGNPLTGFLQMELKEIKKYGKFCWIQQFTVADENGEQHRPVISFFHDNHAVGLTASAVISYRYR